MLTGTSTIETATKGYNGTMRWQAPELLELLDDNDLAEDFHTEASDVWALGMVYLVSDTFSGSR